MSAGGTETCCGLLSAFSLHMKPVVEYFQACNFISIIILRARPLCLQCGNFFEGTKVTCHGAKEKKKQL